MDLKIQNIQFLEKARAEFINCNYQNAIDAINLVGEEDLHLLISEIQNGDGNLIYLSTHTQSGNKKIFGVFSCTYHPDLKLEYSNIEDVAPTIKLDKSFKNIRTVRQLESTLGILNEQVVAIFPENFRSVRPEPNHPVFFFVNKFSKRHLRYTRPFLERFMFSEFFKPLVNLPEWRIDQLVANWVNFHEASHRLGPMPIPDYLFEKSNSFTAGIEELRADLNTINTCFNMSHDEKSEEYLTGLYVLSERLLAYPIFRDQKNFDAISSLIFWKFLNEKKTFNGPLNVKKILLSINELLQMITQMEKKSLEEGNREKTKSYLRKAVSNFIGNIDKEYLKYNSFWSHV